MSEKTTNPVHWSFWIIGVLALIWYALGLINLAMQMTEAGLAAMPEQHRAIAQNRPVWATLAFGVAVGGGALGCLLLLLRKSAAYPVFIASLIGVIVTILQAMQSTGMPTGMGGFEFVLSILMPVPLAVFLVWYAKREKDEGRIA